MYKEPVNRPIIAAKHKEQPLKTLLAPSDPADDRCIKITSFLLESSLTRLPLDYRAINMKVGGCPWNELSSD